MKAYQEVQSYTQQQMEVSSQLHSIAALSLGKAPLVPHA